MIHAHGVQQKGTAAEEVVVAVVVEIFPSPLTEVVVRKNKHGTWIFLVDSDNHFYMYVDKVHHHNFESLDVMRNRNNDV